MSYSNFCACCWPSFWATQLQSNPSLPLIAYSYRMFTHTPLIFRHNEDPNTSYEYIVCKRNRKDFVWVCCFVCFYFQGGVEEVCGKIRVKVHWESETLASSLEDKPRLFLRDVFGPDQRVRVRLGNDSRQPPGQPSVNRVFF